MRKIQKGPWRFSIGLSRESRCCLTISWIKSWKISLSQSSILWSKLCSIWISVFPWQPWNSGRYFSTKVWEWTTRPSKSSRVKSNFLFRRFWIVCSIRMQTECAKWVKAFNTCSQNRPMIGAMPRMMMKTLNLIWLWESRPFMLFSVWAEILTIRFSRNRRLRFNLSWTTEVSNTKR